MDLNDRIRQTLSRQGDIRLAILFGSLAAGDATPQSDLDLAVLMRIPLSAETKMALIGELSQANGTFSRKPISCLIAEGSWPTGGRHGSGSDRAEN